jgi:hypothetical protein
MKGLIINSVKSHISSGHIESNYISASNDYIHHYPIDVVVDFELDGEPFHLVFQQNDTIANQNPMHLCESVSINPAIDDGQDNLSDILNEEEWNDTYKKLQAAAQECFNDEVEAIKMKNRYAQLVELKNEILQALAESRFESARGREDFVDDDEEQLQRFFEGVASDYKCSGNPYYIEIKDELNDVIHDFASEALALRGKILNDEFETLFSEAENYSNLDTKVFVHFVHLAHEHIFGEPLTTPVNIWHIKQNELKTYENGRESIKSLCRSEFNNMQHYEQEINSDK